MTVTLFRALSAMLPLTIPATEERIRSMKKIDRAAEALREKIVEEIRVESIRLARANPTLTPYQIAKLLHQEHPEFGSRNRVYEILIGKIWALRQKKV